MIRKKVLLCIILLSVIPILACSISSRPVPEPKEATSPGDPVTVPTWEENWNKTIKAAQREGKVVVYDATKPEMREAQSKAFKERFGITVEHVPGTASQIAAKTLAEYKANIFYADIQANGVSPLLTMLKLGGVLASLDSMLILPEVLDSKVWYGGKIPFVDQDHTAVIITFAPATGFIINTSLVKPGEINSYKDLLNPKWKQKIILADPTMPPGGDKWFSAFIHSGVLNLDYMKALARQEPVISRDLRLSAEWLSRGKYPISIGTGWANFEEFAKTGLPIELVTPVEGDYLTAGAGALGLMKNPPHPNAAKVFINWFLSKEGATVTSIAYDKHSARIDVPTQGLTQFRLRQPGIKYIDGESEELQLKMPEYRKTAKEIFGHLIY